MTDFVSKSFALTKQYLGQEVEVVIDIPKGQSHADYKNHIYEVDYGYVAGVLAPDGEELDAYYITNEKLVRNQKVLGHCLAIIHRLDDDDDKLVMVPKGVSIDDDKLEKLLNFQEKYYKHEIIREL